MENRFQKQAASKIGAVIIRMIVLVPIITLALPIAFLLVTYSAATMLTIEFAEWLRNY